MDKTDSFKLHTDFAPAGDQPAAIQSLITGVEAGLAHQVLLGVTGSGKTYTMAQIIAHFQRPSLILAHNKTLAAQLYGEMKSFFPENAVEYFVSYYDYYQPEAYVPSTDTYIEKDASINEHIEQMRLSATKSLIERKDVIIVATVSAIYGLGDPETYSKMLLSVSLGETSDPRQAMRRLAEMQYSRNDVNFERGMYRVRGDVLDIFPADSEREAVRIEWFDQEIERLSFFDPLTGQILRTVSQVNIYPKTHYVTPQEQMQQVSEQIKIDLQLRLAELKSQQKLLEYQRLEQRTSYDIEMMMELGYCSGIENYSRYLSKRGPGEPPPTLLEYFPKNAMLFVDESHVTLPQLGGMYRGDRARKENLVNYGFRLPSALDNRPLRFEEFEALSPQAIYVSATPGVYELEKAGNIAEQVVRPTGLLDPELEVRPVATQVEDVLSEIHKCTSLGQRVLITTLTKKMSEDLTRYLSEQGIRVRYLHSDIETVERMEIIRDLRLGKFDVLIGINLLREGLDMPEVALVAIFDADKEGFLRSERSLIQTIGRAARNVHGRAILYADRITGSMKKAMDETLRRREKQMAYNQAHGLTPTSIQKAIHDVMQLGEGRSEEVLNKALTEMDTTEALTPMQLTRKLGQLDKLMRQAAKDLDFEKAAEYRDLIQALKTKNL